MTRQYSRESIEAAVSAASTTRRVVVASGAMAGTGEVLASLLSPSSALVIADETTWEVAGEAASGSLQAAGIALADPVIFPGAPRLHADTANVAVVRRALDAAPEGTVPVAVGAGTINDLVKRAAHEAGMPYAVVATAASMDGYTASGAALVHEGFKQTLPCEAPVAIIADPEVLAAAPGWMTASGYGDLIGKITAGADWIVADAIGVEPVIPEVWTMVQGPLREAIANPAGLRQGDPHAVEELFLGLVTTGLAIQATGSSRPASGSEHQFSHLWEMRGLAVDGEDVSHGFKVAYGTLFSTRQYEAILARSTGDIDWDGALERYPSLGEQEREVAAHIPEPERRERALAEVRAKHPEPDELARRLDMLRRSWDGLRARLRDQLVPLRELHELYGIAGCPVTPEEIGLTPEQVRETVLAARLIRRRYTVLDLVLELGLRDDVLAAW